MIWNLLIKNTTPYKGKLKVKFEKSPYYIGSSSGKLNKVHLNLGFTKLVSRMMPFQNLDGWMADPKKIETIEKYTGGKIASHVVDNRPSDEFTLHNSFLTSDKKYIGDIERAWWYYTSNLVVCDDYPHGVAIKVNPDLFKGNHNPVDSYSASYIEGYYGYTHRGGSLFKIGDRLFDADYVPVESDYPEWQWAGWQIKYDESLKKAKKENDEFTIKYLVEDGVGSFIPFRLRGRKEIENLEEALQAAINLSKYL